MRIDRLDHPIHPLIGYLVGIASVAAATVLRLSLDPLLGTGFPFATLFIAVLVTAWFGGLGPALLASVAGAIAAVVFLLSPRNQFAVDDVEAVGAMMLYVAVSFGIAAIGGAMWRARQRAEEETRAAGVKREELRVTLQSIGDAVITTGVDGRLVSLNTVAADLTGWTSDEAEGKPLGEVFRIFNEQTGEPAPNPALRALEEGRIVGLANHTVLVARDGTRRPIDDSAAPIRDEQGAVTGVVLVFRDVTARRQAEERIRTSEQELADFFENANVGLHWVGPDGIIQRVNRAELELLGYGAEEYVGRHIADFHVDADVITEILARLGTGEILHNYPARMRCKDGSIKHVLINSSVLWDNGKFVHTRCFTLDVTDRSRAAEAQAWLAAVVESSDDAIVSKTLDGIITSWNPGAERLFGYTRAEAIGKPITMIIPPDRREEEPKLLARLRRGERIDPFETVRVKKSGQEIYISLRISPVRDATGRIIGASKLARDVTASRKAAQALRESEERFRTMADNIAQFAWMADGGGSIFWYNKRWFDYTGTTLEQMQGWGWQSVIHPEHAERVVEKISSHLASGEPWEDTFPLRGADGTYRWFLSRGVAIRDDDGRVHRWFGTATDITAQREAEEALKTADQRKDEFLATLAHELRNPLAPVRNSLEIMKRADGDVETLEKARAIVDRQMTHLERLVDDLLDIARISRDLLVLRKQRVELSSILHHALETCRPLAETAGVAVSSDLASQPIYLFADGTRLAQVFSNLLSNACKYSEPGARVRLESRLEGDEAVVAVRDTGRGIPREMLSRVFDMFTQIDQTGEGARGGLGIGLTLVRRLVELHGGRVEGFSEGVGHGSEFVVRLPLAEPVEESATPAREPSAEDADRRSVLIVDDNVDAAESLAILLQMYGHQTALAHDGEAALGAVETVRPDVVLLDIGLPKRSGHEVARWIRDQPWGRDIVLVALTGWGQDEDRRKSREVGFDHHLVKPVDATALLDLLAKFPGTTGRPASAAS